MRPISAASRASIGGRPRLGG